MFKVMFTLGTNNIIHTSNINMKVYEWIIREVIELVLGGFWMGGLVLKLILQLKINKYQI
jgi:hypothetical protein